MVTLYPSGYDRSLVTIEQLRARWRKAPDGRTEMEPEYEARLFAWIVAQGGQIGIGSSGRNFGESTSSATIAGKSFHQRQRFAGGTYWFAAVDLVARNPGKVHRAPSWSEVPVQGSTQALSWGVHSNVGTPGQADAESWHMQPVEIDGFDTWVAMGRPRPKANRPRPATPPPIVQTPSAAIRDAAALATIRQLESGANYGERKNSVATKGARDGSGNPSGAYQFVYATWNRYGGFEEAFLAPPAVQDARAAGDVALILRTFDNDVAWVPVAWYVGLNGAKKVRTGEWPETYLPNPDFNKITVGDYRAKWMAFYAGTALAAAATGAYDPPPLRAPSVGPQPGPTNRKALGGSTMWTIIGITDFGPSSTKRFAWNGSWKVDVTEAQAGDMIRAGIVVKGQPGESLTNPYWMTLDEANRYQTVAQGQFPV